MKPETKRHWLMMRPTGTLWITFGSYTLDEAHRRESTPLFSLTRAQVKEFAAFRELSRGLIYNWRTP